MGVKLEDIAKAAGVSCATVSRVINNSNAVRPETKERIWNIIQQYHYVPNAVARNLSKNETNSIGVVIPDILNPFFGYIIRGAGTVLRKENYHIALCDTNNDVINEKSSLEMLMEQRIRGLIISPTKEQESPNTQILLQMQQAGIKIVLVDRDINGLNMNGVFLDNIKAAKMGTMALAEAGHRKIAALLGPFESKPGTERTFGYLSALEEAKIGFDHKYIIYGEYSPESGYDMTQKLLSLPDPPTAIFLGSSALTMGCIKCVLDHKLKIPDDIAIVGFDSTSELEPFGLKISYVERFINKMGETAANMLMQNIANEGSTNQTPKCEIISPDLVLKGSERYCGN